MQEISAGADRQEEMYEDEDDDKDDERDFDGITVAQSIADAGLEYPHHPDFILQPCPIATEGHLYCFNPPPEHYPLAFEQAQERLQLLPPKEDSEPPTPRTARKMLFGLNAKNRSNSNLRRNPSGASIGRDGKKSSGAGQFLPGLGPSGSTSNLEGRAGGVSRDADGYADEPPEVKPKKKKKEKPNPRSHVMSNALYWARATSAQEPLPPPSKIRPPPTFFSLKFPVRILCFVFFLFVVSLS